MVVHHLRIAYLHLVHASHSHLGHDLFIDPLGATIYDLVVDYFSMPELIPGKLVMIVLAHGHKHLSKVLEGE